MITKSRRLQIKKVARKVSTNTRPFPARVQLQSKWLTEAPTKLSEIMKGVARFRRPWLARMPRKGEKREAKTSHDSPKGRPSHIPR